jgi:hypothetical protein
VNPSEPSFQNFLAKNPQLCASGLAGPDLCRQLQLDYAGERQRLKSAYGEFALCCDWLLDCTPMRRVSCVAPASSVLSGHIEKTAGTPICHGALVAAVLFLRIPYHRPEGSVEVRVGISLRSPTLQGVA